MQSGRPSDRELLNKLAEAKKALKINSARFVNPSKVVGEFWYVSLHTSRFAKQEEE
jgi:hypothetical protein